jgi:hypothetical protein
VKDSDGASDTASEAVQVVGILNVAPSVTSPDDQSSNEGDSHLYDLGSFDDPGPDADWSVDVDWGDGSPHTSFPAPTTGSLGSRSHTYTEGPNDFTVTVAVTDNDGAASLTDSATFAVHVNNVAPAVTLSGPSAANEGDTKSYSYSWSDPGTEDTFPVSGNSVACGVHGTASDEVFTPASKTGSFKCTWSDDSGAGTAAVKATVTDDDGDAGSDTKQVDVDNLAPSVVLSGPTAANEGDTKSYSYSWTDAGSADTFPAAGNSVDCGPKGTASDKVFTPASQTGSIKCTFGDDSGSGTFAVKATVKDDDGGEGSDTRQVDVDNVNPTASNPGFVFNPVLGTATASFSFADLGYLDTHGASFFTWSAGVSGLKTVTETNGAGTASENRTFAPGCYNLTVTGTAKDDDGGTSSPLSIFSGSTTGIYANGFRPPIVDNERNIAKYGNVVPVKVLLTNPCTGASVTNVSLFITTVQGAGSEIIEDTNVVAESVSAADSSGQMRIADGMYIYNLATKSMTAGRDYTVRIRLGDPAGPIILAAVLQPKK